MLSFVPLRHLSLIRGHAHENRVYAQRPPSKTINEGAGCYRVE
jgi:hypothetical protein